MVWGDELPIDSLGTQQLPQVDTTMAFPVVGYEDLAAMGPTQTHDVPPARHLGSHRRPRRIGLTWRGTAVAAVALSAATFAGVWVFSSSQEPGPAQIRQAAPEAAVATPSPAPTPTAAKAKPAPVRPAEPVALHSERPAPVVPSPVHTVTVTFTPKPTATPTPKPTASSPKPIVVPTPDPTSPDPVETSDPADTDEDPTPATEADRG